jgi:hypothetical protein
MAAQTQQSDLTIHPAPFARRALEGSYIYSIISFGAEVLIPEVLSTVHQPSPNIRLLFSAH